MCVCIWQRYCEGIGFSQWLWWVFLLFFVATGCLSCDAASDSMILGSWPTNHLYVLTWNMQRFPHTYLDGLARPLHCIAELSEFVNLEWEVLDLGKRLLTSSSGILIGDRLATYIIGQEFRRCSRMCTDIRNRQTCLWLLFHSVLFCLVLDRVVVVRCQ